MLAMGAYDNTVCTALGVSQSAWYGWLREGEAQLEAGSTRSLKVQFMQAVNRARTQAKLKALSTWNKAMDDGDWRASAEFLARRYPDEWSLRRKPPSEQPLIELDVTIGRSSSVDHHHEITPKDQLHTALFLYTLGILDMEKEQVQLMVRNGTIDDELEQRGLIAD